MEPPVTMHADAVRDEKLKVLRSIRWLRPEDIDESAVRAQYGEGIMAGKAVARVPAGANGGGRFSHADLRRAPVVRG